MIELLNWTWFFSHFPNEILLRVKLPVMDHTRSWDNLKNYSISILFYGWVLLFYGRFSSQWLCRLVQFSPLLVLFYSTPVAILLANGRVWRQQEKVVPLVPKGPSKILQNSEITSTPAYSQWDWAWTPHYTTLRIILQPLIRMAWCAHHPHSIALLAI